MVKILNDRQIAQKIQRLAIEMTEENWESEVLFLLGINRPHDGKVVPLHRAEECAHSRRLGDWLRSGGGQEALLRDRKRHSRYRGQAYTHAVVDNHDLIAPRQAWQILLLPEARRPKLR